MRQPPTWLPLSRGRSQSAGIVPMSESSSKKTQRGGPKLTWEAFCTDNRNADRFTSSNDLVIGLSGYDVLSHDGLTGILALVEYRASNGSRRTLNEIPEDPADLVYLGELNFLRALQSAGGEIANERALLNPAYTTLLLKREAEREHENRLPITQRRKSNNASYTLRRVEGDNWLEIFGSMGGFLSSDAVRHVEEDLKATFRFEAEPFRLAVREIIQNIVLHGGSVPNEGVGYCCYRPFPYPHPVLRFSCSDIGPGFRGSLEQKTRSIRSDEDAIFVGLLYRFLHPEGGVIGLFHALDFIHRFEGRLQICSGSVLASLDMADPQTKSRFENGRDDPSDQWIRSLTTLKPVRAVKGTHIAVDLRIRSTLPNPANAHSRTSSRQA